MLTQERLKELLHYDPDTGLFYWLKMASGRRRNRLAGTKPCYGHIQIMIDHKPYGAHRLAWLYTYGHWPPNEIDHINHNRADNRIANLRLAAPGVNQRNKSKAKNNMSGHTGVYWDRRQRKWMASICVNRHIHRLGAFVNIEDAIAAREFAEKEFGFHPNHGK